MRIAVVPFIAMLLVLLPSGPSGASGPPSVKESPGPAGPGIASSVFRADGSLARPNAAILGERLPAYATRVAAPGGFLAGAQGSGPGTKASWGGRNTAIAIIASAILPGMGELYCYRASRDSWTLARVPVFLAVEGYLWYSYADNHDKGKDKKAEYEAFADAHWSLDRFLTNHPCCEGLGGCESWQDYNESCKNDYNYFYYTPIEEDREEYYENIGKYNAFAFGWDDALDYADPAFTYDTPHREKYVGIRKSSDDYLLEADQRLMGLIVNRVVSMVDTAWLSYRLSKGQDPDKGWGIRFKTFEQTPIVVINRRF